MALLHNYFISGALVIPGRDCLPCPNLRARKQARPVRILNGLTCVRFWIGPLISVRLLGSTNHYYQKGHAQNIGLWSISPSTGRPTSPSWALLECSQSRLKWGILAGWGWGYSNLRKDFAQKTFQHTVTHHINWLLIPFSFSPIVTGTRGGLDSPYNSSFYVNWLKTLYPSKIPCLNGVIYCPLKPENQASQGPFFY